MKQQLPVVRHPRMLRMEFHAQGNEVRPGEIITISELQKRTELFSLYSDQALEDFCAWMSYVGEFFPYETGEYFLTDRGCRNHREIRKKVGHLRCPVSEISPSTQTLPAPPPVPVIVSPPAPQESLHHEVMLFQQAVAFLEGRIEVFVLQLPQFLKFD